MGKRIYCGNLSFQSSQDDVRALFAAHGEVTDVHMVMDRDTGRPRGFAFVEMATEEQAREDRGGGGGGGARGGYGGGGGGGRGRY